MSPTEAKKRLAAAVEAAKEAAATEARHREAAFGRRLALLSLPELERMHDLYDRAGGANHPDLTKLTDDERRILELLAEKMNPECDRDAVNERLREADARVPWPPAYPGATYDHSGRRESLSPEAQARVNELARRVESWPRTACGDLDSVVYHNPELFELEQLMKDRAVGYA